MNLTEKTPNYKKVKKTAKKIHKTLKLVHPPFDPEFIAKALGVQVLYLDINKFHGKEIAGFYDVYQTIIYVNKKISPLYMNYTIAHQLGHHILHQEYLASERYRYLPRYYDYEIEDSIEDVEASAFAENLLIPLNVFDYYSQYGCREELSRVFAVPIELIDRRLLTPPEGILNKITWSWLSSKVFRN